MTTTPAQFCEHLGVLMSAEGYPRVAGRLLGLLLLSPGDRSLDELAASLRVSKASVSVNIRLLEERGIVEQVGKAGDRRDYYRISEDVLSRTVEQRIAKLRRFKDAVGSARDTLAVDARVKRRLASLEEAYDHMIDIMTSALEELRTPRRRTRHT